MTDVGNYANTVEKTLPISVCITTKNNADTIGQCIESVYQWTDEVVVVDTDSDDGTTEICKEYGAKVFQHEFKGLADIKMKAVQHAENEWVLILDADEEIPKELRNEIIWVFDNSDAVAFYIRKREYMLGSFTHQHHVKRPYLAKKTAIYFKQEYVWERLTVREDYRDQTVKLSGSILHYRFDRISEMEMRNTQYSALEALQIVEENKRDDILSLSLRGIAIALDRLILTKGILDGYQGLIVSLLEFYQMILTYGKVRDIYRLKEQYPDKWKQIWIEEECQRGAI
ncbi:glycosyltransferase family 2 protein [Haladaptatus halobius]|uniref:glycosyltransferase family 2 protein n=1 Tax=Haladaptatus halobius TaxID=2884875 RepID=UPI001D09F879|nr:glycosyltransferase family 2 protein [Haladaptatus halobius]